jgi:hypothetical protein
MNKKAQGISMNVINIAAIALLVLVILSVIFIGRMGKFGGQTQSCTAQGGRCMEPPCSRHPGVTPYPTGVCEDETLVCCLPVS